MVGFAPFHAEVSLTIGELEDLVRGKLSHQLSQLVQFTHLQGPSPVEQD